MWSATQTILLPFLFSWFLVLGAFWVLGLLPVPRPARVAAVVDRWGSFDALELGGFGYGSLALISAIGLFLEAMLIRWVSADIRIFAHFKNLVLVACFFGFGLGCYLSRRRIQVLHLVIPLLAFVVLLEVPWRGLELFLLNLSDYVGGLADVHVFGRHYGGGPRLYFGAVIAFAVITPLTGLVALIMVPVGQLVSRYLEVATKGITAYSVNVAASILGIWAFTGICFLSSPPVVWFALLGVSLVVFFWRLNGVRIAVGGLFAVMCGLFLMERPPGDFRVEKWYGAPQAILDLKVAEANTYWSPYQKLTLTALSNGKERVRYVLNTNGSWYQEILNLSPEYVAQHPEYYGLPVPLPYHRYNLPFRFVPAPESVLILGSGMGNDVAAALRSGAKRVVAVEIDPLIERLGLENHPENPYGDARVVAVIDDARAYIQNTNEHFDLIVSSILDSHITQSSFTNIRTDNYVYTREGIAYMLKLLKPNGVLSLSFNSERPWFASRLRALLTETWGHPPLMVYNGANFFVVGKAVQPRLDQDAELRAFVETHPLTRFEPASPTTDDWPYFYSRSRGIPIIVALLSALLIAVCWMVMRRTGMKVRSLQWHFFFLGAGFMLLEVQIISKMALLFGTTWLLNSIVITALLVLILLANATAARWPEFSKRVAYPGLFLALAVGYLTPVGTLLLEGWVTRAVFASLVLCLPVYFAGMVFIQSFARSGFQAEALGSNLFGALVGGLLEALSMWTGIRFLVIVAAAFYIFSALVREREPSAAVRPAAVPARG